MNPIVLKIGGSLLELEDFRDRISAVLEYISLPNPCSLGQSQDTVETPIHVIVGGGGTVDLVRNWDKRFRLGERLSHRLAIKAMALNAELVSNILGVPLKPFVDFGLPNLVEKRKSVSGSNITKAKVGSHLNRNSGKKLLCQVVDLSAKALDSTDFPSSWQVTSDSLALWYAASIGSPAIYLAKSVAPLEKCVSFDKIERLGWLDGHFGHLFSSIGGSIRVSVVHATTTPLQATQLT